MLIVIDIAVAGGLVGTPVGGRVPVMVADATTGNEYAQPIALKSSSSVPGSAATTAEQTNKPTSKSAKQHRERREQLALQNGKSSSKHRRFFFLKSKKKFLHFPVNFFSSRF